MAGPVCILVQERQQNWAFVAMGVSKMTSVAMLGLLTVGLHETVIIKDVLNSNTVVVQTDTEPNLWVSLLGVGTVDTFDPRRPKHLFYLGKEDLGWTKDYLPAGSKARMERLGKTSTGRLLVLLFRLKDGLCWNEWLVRSGGAFFATTDKVDYADEEATAQSARLGIWASLPNPPVASENSESKTEVGQPGSTVRKFRQQMTFTGVPGGKAIYSRRRYARQDWSEFDARMSSMYSGSMDSGITYGGMGVNPNQHWVNSYYRNDGTYVSGHMRTNPNSTTMDNLGRR